ncbi:hypothetical protein BRADI_2g44355v3 [Brachypodium distachyon]|uniref:Uncharacterized protein n=1 Tax=Brachypodium distachyon TaxID=15368 RepID=A0A2K2DDT2_BRADI|nr:hypothetical protein BRADI_2g44355v3 [Brachypodium distachyon]
MTDHWELTSSINEQTQNSTVLQVDQEYIFRSKIFEAFVAKTEILPRNISEVKCSCTDRENPTRKGNSFAHRQRRATATKSLRGRRLEATEFGQLLHVNYGLYTGKEHQISPFFPNIEGRQQNANAMRWQCRKCMEQKESTTPQEDEGEKHDRVEDSKLWRNKLAT